MLVGFALRGRDKVGYRKQALAHYPHTCAICGFGIVDVLEVAHLDGDRSNDDLDNLAVLCPTCHRMVDIDLIPIPVVEVMRDLPRSVDWSKLLKDGPKKAAATRKRREAMGEEGETRHQTKPEA
jgi:5-methylcytosine-specific restriction endonuclease McrA